MLTSFQQGVWSPNLTKLSQRGLSEVKNDLKASDAVIIARSRVFDKTLLIPLIKCYGHHI